MSKYLEFLINDWRSDQGPKFVNTLKKIGLCFMDISDEGAEALAEILKSNNTIKVIDILRNEIGDKGIIALADALKVNNTLKMIGLYGNKIGDKGAKALADTLKDNNNTLMEIDLRNNKIGDDGIRALTDMLKFNHKIKIYIDHNPISDEVKKAFLDALEHNNTLVETSLDNNKVSFEKVLVDKPEGTLDHGSHQSLQATKVGLTGDQHDTLGLDA